MYSFRQFTSLSCFSDSLLVTTIQDSAVTGGNAGVLAYVENKSKATCIFDDMWVWDLNADGALIKSNKIEIENQQNILQPSGDSLGIYNNFIIRAEVSLASTSNKDGCGFVFRNNEANTDYYWLGVYPQSGHVLFDELSNNQWVGSSSAVHIEQINANGKNDIVLVVNGGTFTVYINGKKIAQYIDSTLYRGTLMLAAIHFDEGITAACTFDNVWIWTLDDSRPFTQLRLTPTVTPTLPLLSPTPAKTFSRGVIPPK